MNILIIFITIVSAQVRLDPHGFKSWDLSKVDSKKEKECLVCHLATGKSWKLQIDVADRCTDCHNKATHSGILEHKKAKVDCLSCHRPHRALLPGTSEVQTYFEKSYFNVGTHHKLNNKVHYERSSMPMLKKSCSDCHGDLP